MNIYIFMNKYTLENICEAAPLKDHTEETAVSGGKHIEQICPMEQTCRDKEFHKLHKVPMFYTVTA